MANEPDPFDELLRDDFLDRAPREASAEERLAKARRIAAENNRLRAAGEIADGSGKPRFHARRRKSYIIAISAAVAVGIVVLAIIVAG